MSDRKQKPRLNSAKINGADLAWVEWGSCEDRVLLLAHASGFHGRCWDRVVQHLDGFRVIAIDFRGHGKSASSASTAWDQFGGDIVELIGALELHDVLAVGHSFGAHCIIQAAGRIPDQISKMVVIDPVVFEPLVYSETRSNPVDTSFIAKRRNVWDSPQQMFENFRGREPFSRWELEVLRDYCHYGLVPDGRRYRLACAPDFEARLYGSATEADIHALVAKVTAQVTVVRAKLRSKEGSKKSFSSSPTWPALADAFQHGEDVHLPEYSHFIPMENPGLIASIIQQQR